MEKFTWTSWYLSGYFDSSWTFPFLFLFYSWVAAAHSVTVFLFSRSVTPQGRTSVVISKCPTSLHCRSVLGCTDISVGIRIYFLVFVAQLLLVLCFFLLLLFCSFYLDQDMHVLGFKCTKVRPFQRFLTRSAFCHIWCTHHKMGMGLKQGCHCQTQDLFTPLECL